MHQELDDLDEIYFAQQDAPCEEDWSEDASYWRDDDWYGYGFYDGGWYEQDEDEHWCDVTEAYQQDVADFESNLESCAAAMLNSASAQRTWAEEKKLIAEKKTSREYLPIVGINARPMSDTPSTRAPPKKGGKSKKGTSKRDKGKGKGKNKKGKTGTYGGNTARPLGSTLRDPGKGSSPKCLLCGGLHPTDKCPRRTSGGSAGNNIFRQQKSFGNEVHEETYADPQ